MAPKLSVCEHGPRSQVKITESSLRAESRLQISQCHALTNELSRNKVHIMYFQCARVEVMRHESKIIRTR